MKPDLTPVEDLAISLRIIAAYDGQSGGAVDYERRYEWLMRAAGQAVDAGIKVGFRIDPAEPAWPVILFDLPWHDQHLWGPNAERELRFTRYSETRRGAKRGDVKGVVTVSNIDVDLLDSTVWSLTREGYAANGEGKMLHSFMAERLFGTIPEGYEVDHVDRTPLNCSRSNIRLATRYGQLLNRDVTGGNVRKRGNSYQARWGESSKSLGSFCTREEALAATQAHYKRMIAKAHAEGHYICASNQISWHLPQHPTPWDGHDTDEKYRRVQAFCVQTFEATK